MRWQCRTCRRINDVEQRKCKCGFVLSDDELNASLARNKAEAAAVAPVTLTTAPSLEGWRIRRTYDIVTAECVLGMNVFADMFASIRDFVGGRSKAVQDALKRAKETCLNELRAEAHRMGANAVIAVTLNYSEISGGGKSMLFLVASGTAVGVEQEQVTGT